MASHKVYRSEEIHDNKAHSSIQSCHRDSDESLKQDKEDKVHRQDGSCGSRTGYGHKDWVEHRDKDKVASWFRNEQEVPNEYDHSYKQLHQR